MRSLIDILDLSNDELYALMKTARDIIENPLAYSDKCKGRKLATLFFEPSTRTRLSFEAAMLDLGGGVLSVEAASSSSAAKGESIADTAKVISCYADIMAMRHFKEGASLVAAQSADIPVINAGDGGHNHPTQTLADLLTIYTEKERLSDLTVGLCGDLKYGRTVHSLVNALARYENVRFVFISPEELKAPDYIKNGRNYVENTSLSDAIGSLDVLYMTRIQKERFDDKSQYERLKDSYILTAELMEKAKSDCIVMHPLPRVNEISVSVDSDKRACYFKQVKNGKAMRMALILKLLSDTGGKKPEYNKTEKVCRNFKCVISSEPEIEKLAVQKDGKLRCAYCDTEL